MYVAEARDEIRRGETPSALSMPSSGSKQNDPPAKRVPKYVPDSSELSQTPTSAMA
jgi:hypothetical protein